VDFEVARAFACAVILAVFLAAVFASPAAQAQVAATEGDYYQISAVPIPEGIVLEVGGLGFAPDGRLGVSTRRGEVWLVENPTMEGRSRPHFTRFAQGLHEPLGLAYRDASFYTSQRGELTRLTDTDGDDRADAYETVVTWPLAGNYHEYSYGPVFGPDGDMFVTLNLAWVGHGASLAEWSGWGLKVSPDGTQRPFATGMRSPAGFGYNLDGDLFYAENQGDWVGSGFIAHVEEGDFFGNPAGLRWSDQPGVPAALRGLKPEDIPDTGEPKHVVAERVPALKPPAVWFPHTLMGISTSDILVDSMGGAFGPFAGQLFVGDQGHSKIMRVALERIDGVYQGAVFPFREGFASGILRLAWAPDGSLFVGQTSRGWSATGHAPFALERVTWTGVVPFEMQSVAARPDGFEVTFTRPVDVASAADPASYGVTGFTYHYHSTYGSPAIDQVHHPLRAVEVSTDSMRARLLVDGLREGYVHELKAPGVRAADGAGLLHDVAYYTLNRIPEGPRMTATAAAATDASVASDTGRRQDVATDSARSGAPDITDGPRVPQRVTEMPADWNGDVDLTITIGTEPGLRFDLPSFDVGAGDRVRLTFDNDDDMLHNLVVVLPGQADDVAEAALTLGLEGAEMDYVPPGNQVLYHTALLQPETSESIYFIAPSEPGTYTYVCTFPGHAITMRGEMRVAE
jgi:glucose/arabinose dehydrogenase/azurin